MSQATLAGHRQVQRNDCKTPLLSVVHSLLLARVSALNEAIHVISQQKKSDLFLPLLEAPHTIILIVHDPLHTADVTGVFHQYKMFKTIYTNQEISILDSPESVLSAGGKGP
jgi:hypothetical protein